MAEGDAKTHNSSALLEVRGAASPEERDIVMRGARRGSQLLVMLFLDLDASYIDMFLL